MYTDGTQTTGQRHFLQHISTSAPCPCQHYVQYEQPAYSHRGGSGHQAVAAARQTGHPPPDCRGDVRAPGLEDAGRRAFVERGGHRSPQRRPVFAGPGPYGQSDDSSQVCPWEPNPGPWSCPLTPPDRHYPPVREHCGCVACNDPPAHPVAVRIPHPLPHLRVKGQGYRHKRTVRYVSVEEEEEEQQAEESCGCISENHHPGSYNPHPGHAYAPNGHCGPRPALCEEGEERDSHQERGRRMGGSEDCCNGAGSSHQGFFATEVPQKHLVHSRQKEFRVPPSAIAVLESTKATANGEHPRPGSEAARQRRRQDLVRDQIRQVVTDLEDVLGGLKQVHVEMKEVVQEIDRLTAGIDLSEELPCITQGPSGNFHGSGHLDDLRLAPSPNHRPAAVPALPHAKEDRIILRTNSPSPVHMASVVKTSHFTPTSHSKEANHEQPGANGHPPHLYPARDSEPHPQSLDPKVIVCNSTSNSRTQKPPRYPQNGRCGKGPHSPPKPARTPAYPGRGRHNTSMV